MERRRRDRRARARRAPRRAPAQAAALPRRVSVPVALLGAARGRCCWSLGAALSVVGIGLPLLRRRGARLPARWCGWTAAPPTASSARRSRRCRRARAHDGSPWRRSLDAALRPRAVAHGRACWRSSRCWPPRCCVVGARAGLSLLAAGPAARRRGGRRLRRRRLRRAVGARARGSALVAAARSPLPAAVLALATLEALCTRAVHDRAARCWLPRAAAGGPVREMLAESLGDRSVAIAYWLPDRERFVDEAGRRVELPEPGSGRAWTAVERDGRPVAAIIHDAALDTSRELVQAAAAASSLAIDNERLKADLRARVEELRVSRLRIVEAADAARRRIERDLHDGAQQQLVALALELRLLQAAAQTPEPRRWSTSSPSGWRRALAELRELARGIHPAILTDRGLAPGDRRAGRPRAGAGRRPRSRSTERLPAPVEAAAYFVVAEALTNVAQLRARRPAREVEVAARRRRALVVEVADDGVGGVDRRRGQRPARAARTAWPRSDGTLAIDSPPGGGTRLAATHPGRAGAWRRRRACGSDLAMLVLAAASRCLLAGCGEHDDACASGRSWSPAAARRRRPDVRGPGGPRWRADRGRHPRPGVEPVLGDRPQRRRGRRAPDGRASSTTARPTSTASSAWSALIDQAVATKPDGLVVSIPEPGLAPAIRRAVKAGIPVVSINSGSDVFKPLGVLAHVGQLEDRAGLQAGQRLAAAGVRRALCVNQQVGNSGLDARCAGWRGRCARSGGRLARAPDRRPGAVDAAADRRAVREHRRPTACWPRTRSAGSRPSKALAGRRRSKIGTFDLGPDVLKAVEAGKIALRRRPAGLPAGLPADRDARRAGALRDLPGPGRRHPTGPNFVTEANAAQAIELSARSIRYGFCGQCGALGWACGVRRGALASVCAQARGAVGVRCVVGLHEGSERGRATRSAGSSFAGAAGEVRNLAQSGSPSTDI